MGDIIYVFIIGLFLGSFYNVVALRTMSGENIAFPPSHCTSCNHRLGYLDLIPVAGWISLKGKCRYCKEPISKVYPFGELLTAFSYSMVVWKYGITLEALPHIILVTVLQWATICDMKTMEVPDRFVVIGLLLALPLRFIISPNLMTFGYYVLSGLICFTVLYILLLFGAMGGADVKLYALIGLVIGLANAAASIFYASLVALLYYLPQLLRKEADRKTELPLVPFIAIGVLITYFGNIFYII